MNAKQEKRLRKLARRTTEAIQFDAVSLLNGVKETWSLDERRYLAEWLLNEDAPPWGSRS